MTIQEMIAVMQHFANGGTVQFICNFKEDSWKDVNPPTWNWDRYNYRIKPEPVLVPFDFTDDLVGKIVTYISNGVKTLITLQNDSYVIVSSVQTSYKELLKGYTFIDGSPCGKYKDA